MDEPRSRRAFTVFEIPAVEVTVVSFGGAWADSERAFPVARQLAITALLSKSLIFTEAFGKAFVAVVPPSVPSFCLDHVDVTSFWHIAPLALAERVAGVRRACQLEWEPVTFAECYRLNKGCHLQDCV